jgi:hypothetical protein
VAIDRLDKLSRELNGLSREQVTDMAGTAPAARHLCPLCGGAGDVADQALVEYANQLVLADARAAAAAGDG